MYVRSRLGFWLAAHLVLCAGCLSKSPFLCESDSQCVSPGVAGGRCESNGYCSFADSECASGRRFGEATSSELAGQCVAEELGVPCSGEVRVAAGDGFSCVLQSSGRVACWG